MAVVDEAVGYMDPVHLLLRREWWHRHIASQLQRGADLPPVWAGLTGGGVDPFEMGAGGGTDSTVQSPLGFFRRISGMPGGPLVRFGLAVAGVLQHAKTSVPQRFGDTAL